MHTYYKKEARSFKSRLFQSSHLLYREAFFMVGSDISHLFSAEPKKPLDSNTPLLPDSRYELIHIPVILQVTVVILLIASLFS